MLLSHNRSHGHRCHAAIKLQEAVMHFEDGPGIIQACPWLSQAEGELREWLQSQCRKLELCSLFQLNQYINKPVRLMFPLIWTAYFSSFSSLSSEQDEPVGKMTVWNWLDLSLSLPRKCFFSTTKTGTGSTAIVQDT